jgi:hypothetical protein
MAQIIKHRRGSLESISGATKRAGELLVVTGSTGITAANGNSILFVGVDGSTATPANKVLQGTSVPNLTGASYDTSIDGIPFYDTTAEKLYILNKGGNVEIKASANTGGTGIVSGSTQVKDLLPAGTVSGSIQVIDILSSLNTFSASEESKNSTLAEYTASINNDISNLEAFSSSQEAKDSTLATYTGSVNSQLTELFSTASDHETRVDALEAFSSSLGDGFATDAELAALSSSVATSDGVQNQRLSSIEGFTSSIDTTIKTKLDADGVISSSAQVQIDSVTGFSSFSSSVSADTVELFATASDHESRIDAVEEAIGNGSNIDVRLSNLEATSASHDDRLDQLEADSGSQAGRLNNLESFSSSIETAISVDGTNVTVLGNFTVAGTQTIVDSTTVAIGDNIIELNGSGATNGGLYVKDATAPNTATGSLLWDSTNDYWVAGVKDEEIKILLANGDGVISGSSQVNADSITNFDENVKTKLDADGVISGSAQVQIDDVTGFTSFSSSVDSRVDALEEAIGNGSNIDVRLTNLELTSASHDGRLDNLESFSSSAEANLTELFATASDHESRVDALEAFSSSLDAGFVTQDELASATGALETADTAQQGRLTSLEGFSGSQETKNATLATYTASVNDRLDQLSTDSGSQAGRLSALEGFTSSIDTTIKTKLDADAVVSSSAQIVTLLENQATDFGTGRVSADNIGNVDGTSIITGSFVGDGSGLTGLVTTLELTGSDGVASTVDLLTQGLTFASASGQGLGVSVAGQTVTFSNVNASTSVKGVASFDADDFSVTSGNVSIASNGVRAVNLNSDVAGTGLSLDGVDNSLEVDYGSTSGTAVEGNTSLTVQGTANEIEISGGSVTLGAGGTITIGLPDDVTIATASIQNNLTVGNDLTVVGNLFVQGTTTTIDSTTVQIGDNIIELNGGGASANAGLLVTDVTAPNTNSGSLLWNATADYWMGGALGSEKEFARFDSTPTSGSVQVIGANGLLVDAPITADGTDVSITGDLTIGGLDANSFLVANATKELISVVPQNTGDMIQWNGSSFVASNTIDGGTF